MVPLPAWEGAAARIGEVTVEEVGVGPGVTLGVEVGVSLGVGPPLLLPRCPRRDERRRSCGWAELASCSARHGAASCGMPHDALASLSSVHARAKAGVIAITVFSSVKLVVVICGCVGPWGICTASVAAARHRPETASRRAEAEASKSATE